MLGRNSPLLASMDSWALRTVPCACTIAGCTCSARRTASWSVTCCGPAAGCCAATRAAKSPAVATTMIRRMLPLASVPVRVGTVLLLMLMLLLGEESHVLIALPRRQLPADLAGAGGREGVLGDRRGFAATTDQEPGDGGGGHRGREPAPRPRRQHVQGSRRPRGGGDHARHERGLVPGLERGPQGLAQPRIRPVVERRHWSRRHILHLQSARSSRSRRRA